MANNVLLNSIDHQDLKVLTERSKAYGDNVWYTQTFPQEFRSVQDYYPIFFNKDPNTGKFFAAALFGGMLGEFIMFMVKLCKSIKKTQGKLAFLIANACRNYS